MRKTYTFENEYWVFFGYGLDWPDGKCRECYALLEREKKPNNHCINCWKLEIFFSNCSDLEAVKSCLLEEGRRDHTLSGKWLKREMEIPRHLLTSIPASAHPDPEVERDGVFLIYTQSIEERERKRKKILGELKALGVYRKDNISYRRGCLDFDRIIGPWQEWYDLDRDFEE